MSYGISIKNTNGDLIISEDFKTYSLYSSGTIANATSLPSIASTDMLFVRPNLDGYKIYASTSAGSKIKSTSGYIEYAICKENNPNATGNYGLKVIQANGNIAFDSTKRIVNPIYIARMASTYYVPTSLAVTMPSISLPVRKRYINSTSMRITGFADNGTGVINNWIGTYVTWTSTTSVTVGQAMLNEVGPYTTDPYDWGGNLFFGFVDI